ncbi:MAG: cell division topological specificity factor MinE [Chloroflexota bacterium]
MGFFDRMRGKNNNDAKGSSATAKDRLKMVLTHDRIKVSPEKMKEMRAEIISIIAKYIPEIDADSIDIALEQSDRYQNKLVAEIPFTQERGKAPVVDNDGNDDLEPVVNDNPNELETHDDSNELYLEDIETEMMYADELDTDKDETIKSRTDLDE